MLFEVTKEGLKWIQRKYEVVSDFLGYSYYCIEFKFNSQMDDCVEVLESAEFKN